MFWCMVLAVLVLQVSSESELAATAVGPNTLFSTNIVSTETNIPLRIVEELRGLSHGVRSGRIVIVDENTLRIPDFHFDGVAPDTYFLVGKGDEVTENGTILNSTEGTLKAYDGQTVTLVLPKNLVVSDVNWLAVWCFQNHQNLGEVFFNGKSPLYSPQTFGFKSLVTSGPVVLVDKKTLFIPSFRYDGGHQNVHFWVGNGSEPSSNGVSIPDETGSTGNLKAYEGENLNISLPGAISTDNIEYLGVWSIDEEVSLGHVPIAGIKGVPEARSVKAKSFTMRLPKCCRQGEIIGGQGCSEHSAALFKPNFDVYEHNETHFSNESLDLAMISFEPFHQRPPCESGNSIALNAEFDEFGLLKNGSLLVKGTLTGIFSSDKFCLENIEYNKTSLEMGILVCVPEYKIHKAMFITYVSLTIVSTLCFAAAFFLYYFWLRGEDVHKLCFTVYTLTMTITFLSLTIVQIADVEKKGCEVLGFLFQIFMVASFTLLGILCVDVLIIIKYVNENQFHKRRQRWYMAIVLTVPLFSLFISLARNLTPDVPDSFFKPQYLKNSCFFEAASQRTALFYAPIGISILISVAALIWAKIQIVENDKKLQNHYFWMEKGTVYKFMWRKHLIIVLTSLMWAIEAIIHVYFASNSMLVAIDIVEASQGILVVLLFVVNSETRRQILKKVKARKRRKPPEENLMLRQQ